MMENNNSISLKQNGFFAFCNPILETEQHAKKFLNEHSEIDSILTKGLLHFFTHYPECLPALWVEDEPINQFLIKQTLCGLYGFTHEQTKEFSSFFLDACQSTSTMPVLFNMNILKCIMTNLQRKIPNLRMGFNVFLDLDLGENYLIDKKIITGSHIALRLKQFHETNANCPVTIIPNSTIDNAFVEDAKFNNLFVNNEGKIILLKATESILLSQTQLQFANSV